MSAFERLEPVVEPAGEFYIPGNRWMGERANLFDQAGTQEPSTLLFVIVELFWLRTGWTVKAPIWI